MNHWISSIPMSSRRCTNGLTDEANGKAIRSDSLITVVTVCEEPDAEIPQVRICAGYMFTNRLKNRLKNAVIDIHGLTIRGEF